MNAHVVDSGYLRDLFGTEELRQVFSDRQQLQGWLDFEAALARAEEAVGLVPPEAAAEITRDRVAAWRKHSERALAERAVHA